MFCRGGSYDEMKRRRQGLLPSIDSNVIDYARVSTNKSAVWWLLIVHELRSTRRSNDHGAGRSPQVQAPTGING